MTLRFEGVEGDEGVIAMPLAGFSGEALGLEEAGAFSLGSFLWNLERKPIFKEGTRSLAKWNSKWGDYTKEWFSP
jgi:hypothetical protein